MLSAVIMASGSSERMGKNKLLLTFKGNTFIGHTIDVILECGFSSIILVSCHQDVLKIGKDKNLACVYNINAKEGQSESIKSGIINSKHCDGYMFFTGDQPFLDCGTIKDLMAAFENNKDKIVVPVFKERNGNPVIFPEKFSKELLSLSGDTGGRNIIKNHPNEVLFVNIKNESALLDVDTPEEYQKIIEI